MTNSFHSDGDYLDFNKHKIFFEKQIEKNLLDWNVHNLLT